MGLEIVHIKVKEEFPDCVFVEDPLVVCGDTALITIPGRERERERERERGEMERGEMERGREREGGKP